MRAGWSIGKGSGCAGNLLARSLTSVASGCLQRARSVPRGGKAAVAAITGLALSTIGHGLNELDQPPLPAGQVRRKGGGRRPLTSAGATLRDDLRHILEPPRSAHRCDPCCGSRRAARSSPPRCAGSATRSAPAASSGCCRRWATVGSRTARATRVRIIPTATRSSNTSTRKCRRRRPPQERRLRLTFGRSVSTYTTSPIKS
jgi:hypothetical protein